MRRPLLRNLHSFTFKIKPCTDDNLLPFLDLKMLERLLLFRILLVFFQINPIGDRYNRCSHPIRLNQVFGILRWRDHIVCPLIYVSQILSKQGAKKLDPIKEFSKLTGWMAMHNDFLSTTLCCMEQRKLVGHRYWYAPHHSPLKYLSYTESQPNQAHAFDAAKARQFLIFCSTDFPSKYSKTFIPPIIPK